MKPQLPKLPPVSVLERTDAQALIHDASLESVHMHDDQAIGITAASVTIDESLLEKVHLSSSTFDRLRISDSELKTCDLSGTRCSGASLIRVHIIGGRLTGVDFSRSNLKDVIFEGCKLDMANFRASVLRRVTFVDCMLSETDFQNAELHDVTFDTSTLQKVAFDQAAVHGIDARTSQLLDVRGWRYLKGLKLTSVQLMGVAPQLALELGIIIDD